MVDAGRAVPARSKSASMPAGPALNRTVTVPEPARLVRDSDRQQTTDLLLRAAAAGHLDSQQLGARIAGVRAAGSPADLFVLEADLPASLRAERTWRKESEQRRAAARAGLPAHVAIYAAVMVLLLALWLVDGLAGGNWHPWPLWPALGWGIPLAGQICTALLPSLRLGLVRRSARYRQQGVVRGRPLLAGHRVD